MDENSGSATFCFEATGNLGSGVDTVVNVTTQDITAQGILHGVQAYCVETNLTRVRSKHDDLLYNVVNNHCRVFLGQNNKY